MEEWNEESHNPYEFWLNMLTVRWREERNEMHRVKRITWLAQMKWNKMTIIPTNDLIFIRIAHPTNQEMESMRTVYNGITLE